MTEINCYLGTRFDLLKEDGVIKYFNSHLLLDDKGSLVAVYRKIHLFDVSCDAGLCNILL